jgi:dTDP-4-amino-4,6-dideoxygalactose transaminase
VISFNKPYLTGKEIDYIYKAVESKHLAGNGKYTKLCQEFFEKKYGFKKCLLTTSCTDALEMSAILLDIKPGDEVIIPSYTFVSTANAFVLRGAKIVFADSRSDQPNIDENQLEELITKNTKAIVVVHYAGMGCNMAKIQEIAEKNNVSIVEDAAQAIDSFYNDKPLGSIGSLATFSFHETKNISSGEGGLLVVNDEKMMKRAEVIWEKGTNRAAFFRGEIDKYGWVDIGSSFLPTELVSAFLYAQLENIESIQNRRKNIWSQYYQLLKPLELASKINLPTTPSYATNNAHMFYLVTNSFEERNDLISFLKENKIHAVFHYLSLHSSPYYVEKHDGRDLPNADKFSNQLLRLPIYYELKDEEISHIGKAILKFYS